MAHSLKLATLIVPEPIGTILIASEGGVVVALDFDAPDGRLRRMLRPRYGDDIAFDETHGPPDVMAALRAYFEGDVRAIDSVPVEAGGTPFQREVWTALRKIPPGETRSYSAVAAALRRPAAARAVGRANGLNPVSLVVPCHRLVGADAALTGYGGGLARKRWLLDFEQRYR